MSKTDTKVKIKPNVALQEPPMYKIIYINDEVTSMEFVVGSLIDISTTTKILLQILHTTSMNREVL